MTDPLTVTLGTAVSATLVVVGVGFRLTDHQQPRAHGAGVAPFAQRPRR